MPYTDHGCISVLMSAYNAAATLEAAARSVLRQTYENLELILCDDGSTDGTWEIVRRLAAEDGRVVCFQNGRNLGLGASLNRCLARARGELIARQDADDLSDPARLERTAAFLLASGAPYVGCGVRVFDDAGVWSRRMFPQKITAHTIAQKNPFFHPTMLFRRAVLENAGGYSESDDTRRAEDYDLVMRLAGQGLIGENLPEILYSVYEPEAAYRRRTVRSRLCEIAVRARGLRAMHAPVYDAVYLAKPLLMALVPCGLLKPLKRLQWAVPDGVRKEMKRL